ncbi:MAG: serine/threonine-protein kinase, partial [Desulfobacterales bacterium]
MKMRRAFLLLLLLIVVIGAFYINDYQDRNIVVMKDGTVITVDEIWKSGRFILYKINDEVFTVNKFDVESYGKPDSESMLKHARFRLSLLLTSANSEFKQFANNTTVSFGRRSFWVIGILATTAFCLILLLLLHLVFKNNRPVSKAARKVKIQKPSTTPEQNADEAITPSDIIDYFLNIFRLQIGADPDAPMKTKALMDNASGSNTVYELRIKHHGEWMQRRMSIGPLGDEAGSKSKCYYVIYDAHLVVKIPVNPISEFEYYNKTIKKEGQIVDKLAPKECIVPRVSTIVRMVHKLPGSEHLPVEQREEKYVSWLRSKTKYQKYLKIKNTFVFFMDFSKYYFLSHIIDNLHDVKDAMAQEIMENAETILDNQKFRGRYGKAKESIGIEIEQVFDQCQAAVRQFLIDSGVSSDVSLFRIQTWFLTHLAGKSVGVKEAALPENLVKELNLLIELTLSKQMEAVTACRNTITEYVHKIRFEQNKPQMAGIITNLLDLLAWLRTRRIAMRDLKPDNLLVAGDPAKYPLFLMNPDEYELGIIDVETAVDFEKSKDGRIKQPLLGGTPFYATPSHFFSNAVLSEAFDNLSKILHLQDWYATMVMIFKAATGELMFQNTARLFADIRNKIKSGQMEGMLETEIVADVSRAFWRSALMEFQTRMNQKENQLRSIFLTLPDTCKKMFKKVLSNDILATTIKIKRCINNQTAFGSPQSRQRLLDSSPARINHLRIEFENKVKSMRRPSSDLTDAIVLLKYLRTLKLHVEQQNQLLIRLEKQVSRISAYILLG